MEETSRTIGITGLSNTLFEGENPINQFSAMFHDLVVLRSTEKACLRVLALFILEELRKAVYKITDSLEDESIMKVDQIKLSEVNERLRVTQAFLILSQAKVIFEYKEYSDSILVDVCNFGLNTMQKE